METNISNKCKAYTSLEQSKKLAEILPIESADMCYIQDLLAGGKYGEYKPYIGDLIPAYGQDKIRCWSLAALLDYIKDKCNYFELVYFNLYRLSTDVYDVHDDNLINACVTMIEELHKQKLL